MINYERFQQVITYHLKSINASTDFLKLKVNEETGKKKLALQEKVNQIETKKRRIMAPINRILDKEEASVRKLEENLERINEDVRSFVREYNASRKV